MIVGRAVLEELWRMVDRVRVGSRGYALIVGEDGRLIAHGNPEEKRQLRRTRRTGQRKMKFASRIRQDPNINPSAQYQDDNGEEMLGVAARMTDPNWTVIVEQPTAEAFAATRRLERQLTIAIGLALLGTLVLGYSVGPLVHPAYFRADPRTRSIAEGKLDTRVDADGTRRDSRARRRLQLDGRSARRAAGGHPEAGTPGDVRAHRGGARPRSLASDPEHRQQLQADHEDVGRLRVSRDVPPDGRSGNGDRQAGPRRSPQHREADPARAVPGGLESIGPGRVEAMQQHAETAGITLRTELPTTRSSSTATSSRWAACIAI